MPTITPIDKPVTNLGPSAESQQAQTAKQKAMAAFMGTSQQSGTQSPPQNQQAISPEELSLTNGGAKEAQSDTNEETPPASAPVSEEPPLSTQYAVLARKEKALRAKELAFQQAQRAREAEWAAREEQIKAQAPSIDPNKYIPVDELKRNAYQKLLDVGVSYDDLSQQALQAQSPEFQSIRQMREEMKQEIQQLKQEQEQIRKSSEDQQAQAYQQALKQIEREAKQLVYTDPAYDTIKNTNSVKQVVKLIERTFKDTGELLSVERAAELVEDELVEQGSQYAMLNKIQARLKSAAKSNIEKQQTTQSPKQQPSGDKQMKTLTNAVGNSRQLTARERALLAFKGELK